MATTILHNTIGKVLKRKAPHTDKSKGRKERGSQLTNKQLKHVRLLDLHSKLDLLHTVCFLQRGADFLEGLSCFIALGADV